MGGTLTRLGHMPLFVSAFASRATAGSIAVPANAV